MAYSQAVRIRVIKSVLEDGLSRNEAARVFRVGISSAIRWVEAYEQEGRSSILPMTGGRRSPLDPVRAWLLVLRRKENDLTLDAIAALLWETHAIRTHKSALSRFFAAEDISFKKKRSRQRAGPAGRR